MSGAGENGFGMPAVGVGYPQRGFCLHRLAWSGSREHGVPEFGLEATGADPRDWTLFESGRKSRACPSSDMVSQALQEFACSHSALAVNRRPGSKISAQPPA